MENEIQQVQAVYQLLTEFCVKYSFQILGALIIMVLGFVVAHKISNLVFTLCERKKLDVTLSNFIASAIKILIVVMATIIALGKIGISVTPFVAAIGALSLGAGLALQGLLSNYGAGLNIIITRPFVVGDTVQLLGVSGQVKDVHLAFTRLINEDGVEITIPNKHIVGEILHNSHTDTLVEETIRIGYESDSTQVIALIHQVLADTALVSTEKAPLIGIEDFGESCLLIGVRFWVPTVHYFDGQFQANAAIYRALQDADIHISVPELRILRDDSSSV